MANKTESTTALVDNMETCDGIRDEKMKNIKASPTKTGAGEHDDEVDHYTLPPQIRRRVQALRKIQLESVKVETEFFRKVHELEVEYAQRIVPLHEKRKQIVSGAYEPADEECDFNVPFDEDFLGEELQKQEAIKNDLPEYLENRNYYDKGIDEFWLTALRNSDCASLTIEFPVDDMILKHLVDIEVKIEKDPMKFTLYFHFTPNEYFTNTVLTKEYTMKCEPSADDPFSFEGPEIVSSKGCKIDWKEGKDVTVKVVSKTQKHKENGETRTVKKQVKTDSFFNFFDPPVIPEGDQESTVDDKARAQFEMDAELGQYFRNTFVPRAVLYYTGECRMDDEYEEEEDEDDELDEENEDDDYDMEDVENGGDHKSMSKK